MAAELGLNGGGRRRCLLAGRAIIIEKYGSLAFPPFYFFGPKSVSRKVARVVDIIISPAKQPRAAARPIVRDDIDNPRCNGKQRG